MLRQVNCQFMRLTIMIMCFKIFRFAHYHSNKGLEVNLLTPSIESQPKNNLRKFLQCQKAATKQLFFADNLVLSI